MIRRRGFLLGFASLAAGTPALAQLLNPGAQVIGRVDGLFTLDAGGGTDADAKAWADAVVAAGGVVTPQQAARVNALVVSLKAGGAWQSFDRLWLFASENPQQATIDLVARSAATLVNSPTFTPARGFQGNATTAYINSNYNPNTTPGKYTMPDAGMGVWVETAQTGSGAVMGDEDGGYGNLQATANGVTRITNLHATTGSAPYTPASVLGFWHGQRTSNAAGVTTGWGNNGGLEFTGGGATTGATLPPRSFAFLACNHTVPTKFTNVRLSAGWLGGSMGAGVIAAFYNSLRAYLVAIDAALDTDVEAWVAQVITNGGTVSAARRVVVNQFVVAEKASGAWALTDDYWPLWGENAVQALTSLKQRRLGIANGAPVFTANGGYQFDGVANYVDTGYAPVTHAVALSNNSQRAGIYERTNVNGNNYAMGTASSGNRSIRLRPRVTGNAFLEAGTTSVTGTLPVQDSRGLTTFARTGPGLTDTAAYKNGVAMVKTLEATAVGAPPLPSLSIFIGGFNNAGVVNTPRACSVGFMVVGAALSPEQEWSQFWNVQAWGSAVGAVVDDDAQLWANQVVTNGGTVSAARLTIVSNFITAEKRDGTWPLTDDYWPLWGENAQQALTSLKQRRLAVAVAAPVFAANQGYTFDGVANYIDTGFIFGTHGSPSTSWLGHLSVYERTNVQSNAVAVGTSTSSIRHTAIRPRSAVNSVTGAYGSNSVTIALPSGDSRGLTYIDRTDPGTAPLINIYKNGSLVGSGSTAASAVPVTLPLWIGGENIASVLTVPRACQVGFVTAGQPLPAALVPLQFNNVQAWANAIGASPF